MLVTELGFFSQHAFNLDLPPDGVMLRDVCLWWVSENIGGEEILPLKLLLNRARVTWSCLSLHLETTEEASEDYLDERWTVKRLNRFL